MASLTDEEWHEQYDYDPSRRPKLIQRDRSWRDPRYGDPSLICECGHLLILPYHLRDEDAWGGSGCRWCPTCHRDPIDLRPIP